RPYHDCPPGWINSRTALRVPCRSCGRRKSAWRTAKTRAVYPFGLVPLYPIAFQNSCSAALPEAAAIFVMPHPQSSNDAVIDWLLDADASIRWQVMRDLTDAPAEIVAAERSRVASEGWGPRLLDQQRPDGHWGNGVATPQWWSNLYTLLFLRDLGVDPESARARAAIDLVRGNVTWGPEFGDSPFFEGEVEPCINGRVVALGAYFGERSD